VLGHGEVGEILEREDSRTIKDLTLVDSSRSAYRSSSVQLLPYHSAMDTTSPLALAAAAFCFGSILVYRRYVRPRPFLPPGPSGLPLVGNLFDVPKDQPWLEYERWAREYGWSLAHLRVLGKDIFVVNTAQVASDLFEKKGAIYSDRPPMTMINDLIGLSWHFIFMPRNQTWKQHRQLFSQEHNMSQLARTRPIQVKWTNRFLRDVLADPDSLFDHLQHMATGIVLEDTYAIEVQPHGIADPFIAAVRQAIQAIGAAGIYGTYMVDYLPLLKHLPTFLAKFKQDAREWKKSVDIAWAVPFDIVKKSMAEGSASPCVSSNLLGKQNANPSSDELVIRQACAGMLAQGSAASVSAMGTFCLAMVQYPHVQAKAQAEIDALLHGSRLPTFEDFASLPYLNAIVKEVLRWNPVVPLAFPHRLEEDDDYNEYHLPAGSVIVPNTWAILHDPVMYPNPHTFDPERFLTKDGRHLNPAIRSPDVAFGYARRTCPGKALAMSSLTLGMASILATLNISKAVDKHGNVITPSGEYTRGSLRYPKPFPCRITPRSEAATALIRATL
jgi:cytochrome P450